MSLKITLGGRSVMIGKEENLKGGSGHASWIGDSGHVSGETKATRLDQVWAYTSKTDAAREVGTLKCFARIIAPSHHRAER